MIRGSSHLKLDFHIISLRADLRGHLVCSWCDKNGSSFSERGHSGVSHNGRKTAGTVNKLKANKSSFIKMLRADAKPSAARLFAQKFLHHSV